MASRGHMAWRLRSRVLNPRQMAWSRCWSRTRLVAVNLWWASNPAWLRKVGYRHHLRMSDPQMVPEGSGMEFRAADGQW